MEKFPELKDNSFPELKVREANPTNHITIFQKIKGSRFKIALDFFRTKWKIKYNILSRECLNVNFYAQQIAIMDGGKIKLFQNIKKYLKKLPFQRKVMKAILHEK